MNRRGFLIGLGVASFAAPAVVRAASLMQIRGVLVPVLPDYTFTKVGGSVCRGSGPIEIACGSLRKGDVITFAGVYALNRVTSLRHFVVTHVESNRAFLYPPMENEGLDATVDALPSHKNIPRIVSSALV